MKIGMIGLGLIGGSLGLALRSHGHTVLGVSRQALTCQRAIARGAVDDASLSLSLMQTVDVVFLCTPLAAMQATVIELVPHLAADTVLTDVGSVKGWVVETIAPLWSNFVGGHPMAGTAESGIEAAQQDLFINAPYVLTPTETTPARAVQLIEDLVRPLQTRLYHCHPDDHDLAVAWISHLPVMTSASLIAACLDEADPAVLGLAHALASSGFRDTSRVGGGNPELGVMMAQYNQAALRRSLHAYRDRLDQIITQIEQSDWQSLEALLKETQQSRSEFL
ncbi:prephenate/arogenate dehydrogenase [Stenomitos frigidus]|uniref:Arogenate dehydrogenase n=1 Tax=Stenomitos frigidus ULC18 TaxID=2107698 RepID=A0A2T1DXE2_9CYAN|nr:prephenate/arogenate dehydrogenase [Stenomitos frigidus]PSB25139.1 arogenate dehydrogenase [Stenomitos frigidus ULC18]